MVAFLDVGPFSAADGEGRVLLDEACFRIPEEGLLVALVGASGSGKSTLLRQLVGLTSCSGVRRSLGGRDYDLSELPRWRAQVTLLAQDAPMLPTTLDENLSFPFRSRGGLTRSFERDLVVQLLDQVGLGSIPLDRAAHTLSGGERHRLALVRGLLWDPTIMVADEPLAALDQRAAAVCFELLEACARRPGHAVLAVFHDPAMAARADLRLKLSDGKVEVAP